MVNDCTDKQIMLIITNEWILVGEYTASNGFVNWQTNRSDVICVNYNDKKDTKLSFELRFKRIVFVDSPLNVTSFSK